MSLVDTRGVLWAHSKTVKAGDMLRTDGGFTCLGEGVVLKVTHDGEPTGERGRIGGLYIPCDDGKHYLDGQIGDDGELVGLYPASS